MSPTTHPLLHRVVLVVLFTGFSAALPAQTKPNKAERREMKFDAGSATVGKPNKRDTSADSTGGKSNSDDPQSRVLSKLREQLDVTDDAEWEVIAERINKVGELRRNVSSGGPGFRGNPSLNDKSRRSTRSGVSTRPEQDALRAALSDKLPDAEIRARLARVHEVHLQDEAKLTKAQEDLRAVLTVRQEAVAVTVGLLPP